MGLQEASQAQEQWQAKDGGGRALSCLVASHRQKFWILSLEGQRDTPDLEFTLCLIAAGPEDPGPGRVGKDPPAAPG